MDSGDFSGCSALVIDDNRSVRDFNKSLLLGMGFGSVKTARDGEQATVLLAEQNFDLILSDAVMPGIDGVELLTLIRSNPRTSATPFIMISGFPDRSVMEAAAGGVTDFIVKPFTFEVFSRKVKTAVDNARRHKMRT